MVYRLCATRTGMNMSSTNIRSGPPSPEEFQRQLSEFMRQHFPGVTNPSFASDGSGSSDIAADEGSFRFTFKPREVKSHLDRFVIKQDDAKKVLSVALCDHYNHVRLARQGKETPNYAKQNIILIGPTGVGKTYLIRSVAELVGVPFVKADATKFSETGYVGADVEDMVRELVRRADGDIERAQYGIIYIDEIDKIGSASSVSGRDVSGRGVQTNLLKLMEDTEVSARAPNDIAGQIQSMMDMQRGGRKGPGVINTKHILFIVSGAFDGLEKIVRRRLREAVIGFNAQNVVLNDDNILSEAQTRDFIDFGFEPEFIGRLPVRVHCHALNVDDLFHILKNSEGSIIRQYEQDFAAYGIEMLFRDDGLRRIAELAVDEKTGARGLMTVCEGVFREFKFELPSTVVKQIVVSREMVDDPSAALKTLLAEQAKQEHVVMKQVVSEFANRFRESFGLTLVFSEEAAEQLVTIAFEQKKTVRDVCAEKFKDFQFGLKLVSQNTGQTEFVIDRNVVDAPDKAISDWVVGSYRKSTTSEG
jgi:ATP-dependent Clp protease ATP-binding subunit ClpX